MSNLQERESRRKASIVGSIIEKPTKKAAGSGGRGRPKEEGRELKSESASRCCPTCTRIFRKSPMCSGAA